MAIRDAILTSTHFIALISEHSVNKRSFVQKELAHALEILAEFPPDQIFLVPVRLDSSSPKHERLRQLHWIDLFPNYNRGFRDILDILGMTLTERSALKEPEDGRREGETLDDVRAMIRARAEKSYPDDFSTRKYVIDTELTAWRKLQELVAHGIPPKTLSSITNKAKSHCPEDFSTRLYVIENEVEAWRTLQRFASPEVPGEIMHTIKLKAERDYPDDFSTRLYVIENEIAAWKDLYQ
jgi:macrodomain Ter protein organizer (MatP/YcbG family)